ncbi:hypothetical protein U1Q18_030872, partial [Sarracenia purpurea var. burkii]
LQEAIGYGNNCWVTIENGKPVSREASESREDIEYGKSLSREASQSRKSDEQGSHRVWEQLQLE